VVSGLGALVCGRTLFDFTDGWGGRHTMDVPVVVVTHQVPTGWVEVHPGAPFHFVTDGVEAAVAKAQEIAGDHIERSPPAPWPGSVWSSGCWMKSRSTWCRW
jgi:dihydrofolate reductase